ncbi:MAG: M15 family metallopeptidase [Eubacterium sp.]|nr:M15 family metallopeptidase [Eubacterium sp.]
MNRKKALQLTAIVLSVILVASLVIFFVSRDRSDIPESSSNTVLLSETSTASTKPLTSTSTTKASETQKTSVESTVKTTAKTTVPTTKKKTPKSPSSKNVDILVNANNPVPDDWKVDLVELRNGNQIDKRAYPSLQKMMDDARAEGYNPLICSSYRSTSYQQKLFDNSVQAKKNSGMSEKKAIKETEKWIAVPGTSEHETGLAVDIVSLENQNLDNSQLNSACQKWLMKHCYDYGFILRYPKDKTKVTGIGFEPWHYRYVGYDIAQYIKKNGICLEEYKK